MLVVITLSLSLLLLLLLSFVAAAVVTGVVAALLPFLHRLLSYLRLLLAMLRKKHQTQYSCTCMIYVCIDSTEAALCMVLLLLRGQAGIKDIGIHIFFYRSLNSNRDHQKITSCRLLATVN